MAEVSFEKIINDNPNSFTTELNVKIYQLERIGTMSLTALLSIEQELGEEHMDNINMGYEWLKKEKKAFLILKHDININRMPKRTEVIRVKTEFVGIDKIRFYRKFYVTCGDELLITIIQESVMVDYINHTPLKPEVFFSYGIIKPIPMDKKYKLKKLKAQENMQKYETRIMRYSNLDCNGHVNNAVYGDFIEDCMPDEFRKYKNVHIDYIHEAMLNDKLDIYTKVDGDKFYIEGRNKDILCFSAMIQK